MHRGDLTLTLCLAVGLPLVLLLLALLVWSWYSWAARRACFDPASPYYLPGYDACCYYITDTRGPVNSPQDIAGRGSLSWVAQQRCWDTLITTITTPAVVQQGPATPVIIKTSAL